MSRMIQSDSSRQLCSSDHVSPYPIETKGLNEVDQYHSAESAQSPEFMDINDEAAAAAQPSIITEKRKKTTVTLLSQLPSLLHSCEALDRNGVFVYSSPAADPASCLTAERCDHYVSLHFQRIAMNGVDSLRQRYQIGQFFARRLELWWATTATPMRTLFYADIVSCGGPKEDSVSQHMVFASLCNLFPALVQLPLAVRQESGSGNCSWSTIKGLMRNSQLAQIVQAHINRHPQK